MTAIDYRAWRKRLGLSRTELLDALHELGFSTLTLRGVDTWGNKGPPPHMVPTFTLMERAPAAWRGHQPELAHT